MEKLSDDFMMAESVYEKERECWKRGGWGWVDENEEKEEIT
jgi:hypothetical protein